MKIEVEKFIKLPSFLLFMFPPCDNDSSNDSCLLTCKEYPEIRNAVCTDDGRVYDAHALRTWLKTQEYEKFVIPGVVIHTIRVYTWRNFKLHVDFYKKTLMFMNIVLAYINVLKKYICVVYTIICEYKNNKRSLPETSDSEAQTDDLIICEDYKSLKYDTSAHSDIDQLTLKFQKMNIKKKIVIPSPNSAFTPYTHICF